jgi:hypothetical protein
MSGLRTLLLRFARSAPGGLAARLVFDHMTFALPVKRLRETENLLAFHHPQPAYPLHILLVPKRGIQQLTDLEGEDLHFLGELVETVRSLVEEFRGVRRLLTSRGRPPGVSAGARNQEISHSNPGSYFR